MATTNKNVPGTLSVTGTGPGVNEVLAGLVSDLATGLRAGETGNAQLSAQFEQLKTASGAQTGAVTDNTQAVLQNTIAQASSGGGSTAGSIGSTVAKYVGGGLTLSPLLTGLAKLFGVGGQKEAPPALVAYTRPPSIQFEGTISRSETPASGTVPPASGTARPAPGTEAPASWAEPLGSVERSGWLEPFGTQASANWPAPLGSTERASVPGSSGMQEQASGSAPGGTPERASGPQITIQVQAMDSRSFLDHSDDIARAVREAMLNSHSLNDVVNEL